MKKIIVSHSGKQHSYHLAVSLLQLGLLKRFFTSSYVTNKAAQNFFIKSNNKFFIRRFITGLSGRWVSANWRFELYEFIMNKLYGKSPQFLKAVAERDENFDVWMAKKLKKQSYDIFWGFQGSCFESLKSAKEMGKTAIVELATAHFEQAKIILELEKKLVPQWADSIDYSTFDKKYEQRLLLEPQIADKVVVASEFSRKTLIDSGIDPKKIIYLPLGFEAEKIEYNTQKERNGKLKVLFAGTITQRKGVHYLLKAFNDHRLYEHCELTFIGSIQGSGEAFKTEKGDAQHKQAVSQPELFKLYKDYDVLILPSLFEGFGLVLVEAMAAGLPVIATTHCFGAELIINGENGYLVPIRDSDAIANKLMELAHLENKSYLNLRINARKTALDYTWHEYKKRLNLVIESLNQ